jgi:hypothetical protein
LTNAGQQVRYSYLVTVVGVVLMAITQSYAVVRVAMIGGMSASRVGFGNRQFASVNPFNWISSLTVFAVIIAIMGLAWLGLALRKSPEGAAK